MRILNAMTVDVEDYFQVTQFERVVARDQWHTYESRVSANTDRLLRIFDDAGVTATFFILGWVAERFPRLVSRIASQRHEIASHGYAHRLVYDQTPDEFRADVRRARDIIQALTGAQVLGYRAPSYSITARSLWAIDILIEEGFAYDASVFPIHHDRYGIPGSPRHPYLMRRGGGALVEVPGSTVRLGGVNVPIAGGGYFRIAPYQWTRWGIARVNDHEGEPAVFYLHPWEIDPDQPRLPAGRFGAFRHYRHLDKTEARLKRLLGDFSFGFVSQILAARSACQPAGQPRPALVR